MTTLFSTCVDITEKVIKQQTITAASLPIIATILDDTNTNITSTLFGISSLPLDASYWTITGNTCNNSSDINFGFALTDYALPLKLRLTTSDGISIALTTLSDTTIESGNELILYSGTGITLTLDFGTAKLSNAILELLFKGNSSEFPSGSLSAKYYDNSNTLQTTIPLTASKWSKREVGTLGEIFFEYGNTQTLPTINSVINLVRITDTSNNIWFEADISIPTNLKPNALIYSNSLVLRINDPEINLATHIAPSNANSLLHLDFNGRLSDQSSNLKIASFSGVDYNSVDKLFSTECLVAGASTNISYEGVVFPNEFTFNCFCYFTTSPSGRLVALAEKNGVFALKKTVANNLEVSINNSVIISTSWVPSVNVWNHLWVQKTSSQLRLRVNSADINTAVSYATTTATNSNPFVVCSGVLGLCNGIYISSSSAETFAPFVQPLPKRRYCWDDVSFYEWLNLGFLQLKSYF
ncbi:MAG: hypothetical protein IM526_02595 [Microcystis sp. M38BS1]|uniref:hypothetical protein n=1 Tax=Microcystis sp. M38BS1 TaxID=2771188 RepID=UPI0031FDA285|nr:hypothetical protein [Microcystis sp. M38BS1]MCA6582549.1 hypothetical protein [Pseudanabaena sp. M34BS1SP1A06MG]